MGGLLGLAGWEGGGDHGGGAWGTGAMLALCRCLPFLAILPPQNGPLLLHRPTATPGPVESKHQTRPLKTADPMLTCIGSRGLGPSVLSLTLMWAGSDWTSRRAGTVRNQTPVSAQVGVTTIPQRSQTGPSPQSRSKRSPLVPSSGPWASHLHRSSCWGCCGCRRGSSSQRSPQCWRNAHPHKLCCPGIHQYLWGTRERQVDDHVSAC